MTCRHRVVRNTAAERAKQVQGAGQSSDDETKPATASVDAGDDGTPTTMTPLPMSVFSQLPPETQQALMQQYASQNMTALSQISSSQVKHLSSLDMQHHDVSTL